MELCSGLGFCSHHCGEHLQLQEVTSKWPVGQAGLDFLRQEDRAGEGRGPGKEGSRSTRETCQVSEHRG